MAEEVRKEAAEATPASATNVARKRKAAAEAVPDHTPESAETAQAGESVPAADGGESVPAAKAEAAAKKRRPNSRRAANDRIAGIQAWIDEMPDGDARRYLDDRLLPQMEWYRKKSAESKKWYVRLMSASIAIGAMIPVFSVFTDGGIAMKALLALLGSAVTAINAMLALHNYKDLWNTYRKTREDLLQTLYYYFNNTGIFDGEETREKKDRRLIQTCEERMEQEHTGWSAMLDK